MEAVQAAIQPNTRLVLVETPTNPRQRICDLRRLAEITHANGALLAVDNTLLSPYLQQPLARGADLVIHSATKSLSGHSDLTAGVLALNDSKLIEELYLIQNGEGGGLAPFDSWLLLRGIKTLAVRIDRQQSNAQQLAEYLLDHPAIQRVHYPGLRCHPGHELHLAQASGAGSLVSFETGSAEASQRILESLSLFTLTVSLGSVSSFASLPCRFSHASIPDRVRSDHGLPDDLVRLAVGIEKAEDLLQDLDQSLSLVNPIYSVPGVPRKRH